MRSVTVYMSDGDTITTSINGTDQEIIRHYLGNRFEAGSDTKHHVALCVHFHDTDKRYGLVFKCIEHVGTSGFINSVRKEVVKVDDTNSFEEIMLTNRSGDEYALSDVWVYDPSGQWIEGIGYKHATTKMLRINSEDLKTAVAYCFQASDNTSRRYSLAGLRFEFNDTGKECTIIGTDGRRMHIAKVGGWFEPASANLAFTLNHDTVKALVEMSSQGVVMIDVQSAEADVLTIYTPKGRKGETTVETKQAESHGRFPNWKAVLPESRNEFGVLQGTAEDFNGLIESVQAATVQVVFGDNGNTSLRVSDSTATPKTRHNVRPVHDLKYPLSVGMDFLSQAISHVGERAAVKLREFVNFGSIVYSLEVANFQAVIVARNV